MLLNSHCPAHQENQASPQQATDCKMRLLPHSTYYEPGVEAGTTLLRSLYLRAFLRVSQLYFLRLEYRLCPPQLNSTTE